MISSEHGMTKELKNQSMSNRILKDMMPGMNMPDNKCQKCRSLRNATPHPLLKMLNI